MNAQFKTLSDARTAYEALEAESTVLRARIAGFEAQEAELAQIKADSAVALTENENLKLSLAQKDLEITDQKGRIDIANGTISELRTRISELEKGQKTVQIAARELVASTGGAPVNVDQAEIAKMQAGDEREFMAQMQAEKDPRKLAELYNRYNEIYRPGGIRPAKAKKK